MKILAIITLTIAMFFSVLSIQAAELRDGHPDIYIVKKGDTLWDISAIFLEKPWLWPEIWHVNPEIDNPHLIFPGDELRLVYMNGKPRIIRSNDEKLSPQIRVLSEGDAIPTIPLDAIRPFLYTPRILSDEEIDGAPYILAADAQRLIFGQGHKVYFRGIEDNDRVAYSLFRKGDPYIDPDTQEVLGIEAIHLGSGKKIRAGDPATMMIDESVQEIMAGDRALPFDDHIFPAVFMLRTPSTDINAYIISVYGGVTQIGTYNVVVLNKGEREGLEVGHVLTVMQSGRTVDDTYATPDSEVPVKLPSEEAGELLVFRTFEKTSLGIIMRATRPMHVMDTAVTPN